ncbi:MAG: ATP-grasp domain-containing protein, partial [Gallionellaceae bacterium]
MKRRVLVFPAGTEIGLEIFHALEHCKEVSLFGAGQDISNPARFVYPAYHVLPAISEPGWVDALIALCRSLHIDYIFPAYDDVIVALSREAEKLPAKVISSPSRACEITRSKSETYRALDGIVRVPRLYASAEEVDSYPVFVKPDRGQGSFGIARVDDKEALVAALRAIRDPIICEFLPGEEYTVDCFSDREKGVLFAGARSRRRTRNGISVNTLTEALPEATVMAKLIGRELGLHGAWFFQLKRAQDGQLALLEIAPRIA